VKFPSHRVQRERADGTGSSPALHLERDGGAPFLARAAVAPPCPAVALVVLSSISTTELRERAHTAGHALRGFASRVTWSGKKT
jgi:hypothetical protein